MKIATFYIINDNAPYQTQTELFHYGIYLASHFVQQGAKVYLYAENKTQAEQLDELLWQLQPEQFQAHNLIGEGPYYGTPIEIGYGQLKPNRNRQLVINLANLPTNFAESFTQVVDFVPCEQKAKQLARERYKIYRQAGFEMQTIALT